MRSTSTLNGTVIVARSREGNAAISAKLKHLGIDSYSVDTIEFEPPETSSKVESALLRFSEFDWVVFTSARGASSFAARAKLIPGLVSDGRPKFAAVGPGTAAALEECGYKVSFIPPRYLTSELGRGLPAQQGSRVLLLRADIADSSLPEVLESRGIGVTDIAIYRTRTSKGGTLDTRTVERASLVVFASPSEVWAYKEMVPPRIFTRLTRTAAAACIGPVTAKAAAEAGFHRVVMPKVHTLDALVDIVGRYFGVA